MRMRKQIVSNLAAVVICAALQAATLTFTACSSDDDNEADARLETTTYNDLDYFQRTIVNVDDQGNLLCRQYGVPLYENDTTHLYIGVETIEAAEKIFRCWLAPDIEVTTGADNSITAPLTDEEGKSQGTVFFRPGNAGTLAEVTVSPETRLLHFSQITFLVNSAWPYNSAKSKWHVGDIVHDVHLSGQYVKHFKSGDIPREWVCVREASNGVNPMFCATTKQPYGVPVGPVHDSWQIRRSGLCPSLGMANVIKDLLGKDWDFFDACFEESGGGPLLDSNGFWIDDEHTSFFISYYYEVYFYRSGYHYGEEEHSNATKRFLLKIDWVGDGQMHDGGTY